MFCFQSENRILLSKLINKYPPEIDASVLQKILKGHWKAYLLEKPSLELCKSLVMLRDYNISGRINLMEIPVLLHMLHFWRVSYWLQPCARDYEEVTSLGPSGRDFKLRYLHQVTWPSARDFK